MRYAIEFAELVRNGKGYTVKPVNPCRNPQDLSHHNDRVARRAGPRAWAALGGAALLIGCSSSGSMPTGTGGAAASAGGKTGQAGGNSGGSATIGGSSSTTEVGGSGTASGGASSGGSGTLSGGASSGGSTNGGSSPNGGHSGDVASASGAAHTGGATASGGDGGSTPGGGSAGAANPNAKFVGNITTNGVVRDGFVKYWSQITPENEGKWGSVEVTQGNRNWAALDAIYKYAQDNKIPFKEHNFVWGSQQPAWVASLPPAGQQAAVKAWMQAFCDRYPNTQMIDVVNEPPPHTTPPYKDGIGGDGVTGFDWIVNSFVWARAACPHAILILNDYNTIESSGANTRMIQIVNAIRKAGAPIDAIGAQAHDTFETPTSTVKGFLDDLATTGLPVYISEYDIPIADDAQQQMIMQEQMTMFWNDPNVKGITLWGYIVGSTWKANTGIQQPDGTERPAMTWLMKFLGR